MRATPAPGEPSVDCAVVWWHYLLYLNIWIDGVCPGVAQTWYLCAEFAMFMLSPLVLLPLYFWNGRNRWGLRIWALFMLVSMLIPLAITLSLNMAPLGVM